MRKLILPLIALVCLAIPAQAEAGPLRRLARGAAVVATSPLKGIAARRANRAERRAARPARLFGC